jgi:hypothetical protein
MARNPFTAVSRFRAEKAFFINGFKVRGLPENLKTLEAI